MLESMHEVYKWLGIDIKLMIGSSYSEARTKYKREYKEKLVCGLDFIPSTWIDLQFPD